MFTIDRASGLPIYLQIRHQIVYEIALGRLEPGAPLPSIRQLAASLRVTTVTVRHAYDALAAENLVVSHPGKGVKVADLSADARAQVSLRREALADLFTPAVNRARALGYSAEEIRAGFQRALAVKARPRVVFVGSEQEFVDRYTPLLAGALRDLGIEVEGVLLSDLRRRGVEALGALELPEHVATLVRSYAEVRKLLRDTAVPVLGLALELSSATRAELLALPRTARAVLVAERVNLIGMAHLIEQYWVPAAAMRQVPLESRTLAAALRDAEVIIHSLHARRSVLRSAAPGRLLELRHDLSPISTARLRDELVASRLAVTDPPARMANPA